MASAILAELKDTVNNSVGVMKSATALILGFKQKIADAIAAAIANGATEEELKPFVDLETALETEAKSLADAVAANP